MWSHRYHGIHDPVSPELVLIQVFWPKSRGYKDCAGVLPSVFFLFSVCRSSLTCGQCWWEKFHHTMDPKLLMAEWGHIDYSTVFTVNVGLHVAGSVHPRNHNRRLWQLNHQCVHHNVTSIVMNWSHTVCCSLSSEGNHLLQTDRLHPARQRRHQSHPVSRSTSSLSSS